MENNDSNSSYHILRAGKALGLFTKEQIIQGLKNGTYRYSDHIWDPKNKEAGWRKISDLISEPSTGSAATPLPPEPRPPNILSTRVDNKYGLAALVILIGSAMFAYALTMDPNNSAIRQAVIQQMETNGLLVILIGVLIAKR
jgi:hypothetical protein